MGRIPKIVSAVVMLALLVGCAPTKSLTRSDDLEAKDWLHAGDLAYKVKDYDNAQYFYELVINKYPDTYYAREAKENLGYVKYQKSLPGRAIEKGKEFVEPIF